MRPGRKKLGHWVHALEGDIRTYLSFHPTVMRCARLLLHMLPTSKTKRLQRETVSPDKPFLPISQASQVCCHGDGELTQFRNFYSQKDLEKPGRLLSNGSFTGENNF